MTHLLRSLIRQVLLESVETYTPVAPRYAPLGKYAFANVRLGSPKPPPEEDTQVENALYRALFSHFNDNRPLSKEITDQVLDFIDQGLYADIFRAPPPGTLYRGLAISSESVAKKFLPKGSTFNDAWRQIIETGEDFASFKTQLDLTNINERYTASWTKSLKKARGFAEGDSSDFAIILCAAVEDSPGKWIDCEGLYELEGIDEFKDENEVVAAGTIRVSEVMIRLSRDITSLLNTELIERLKNLPKDQRVADCDLDLEKSSIASLPEGLHVKGSLVLSYNPIIISLPKGLKVGGSLYLTGTGITSLPDDLQVEYEIYGFNHKYWDKVPKHLRYKLM